MNIEEAATQAGIDMSLWSMGAGSIAFVEGVHGIPRDEFERFAKIIRNQALEDAANGSSVLAKKWWARHCETNKHMETTREAHEDFCQLERAIRAMKEQT